VPQCKIRESEREHLHRETIGLEEGGFSLCVEGRNYGEVVVNF